MGTLSRFGVSVDSVLLDKFDKLITEKGYSNRSEAIRDMIRDYLVREEWKDDTRELVGTITIIYNHHTYEAAKKMTKEQHAHYKQIISCLHVHLDAENCLEVIVVKGAASEIKHIANELIGMKGVMHGKLVTTTTGGSLVS